MFKIYILILVSSFSSLVFGVQNNGEIDIRGYIHYPKVDEWSKNIVDDSFSIWNAVIGEGSLKHPAGDSLFVIKAKNANKQSQMDVEIKNLFLGRVEVLRRGLCSSVFSKGSRELVCSVIIPKLHFGDVTVKVDYKTRGAKGSVINKKVEINYGGSGC